MLLQNVYSAGQYHHLKNSGKEILLLNLKIGEGCTGSKQNNCSSN
jgi:hypothetical protein